MDSNSLISVLIANGALLAMISLRNSDVATRYRANVDELLYKAPKHIDDPVKQAARIASLRQQNAWFSRRYVLMSIAFVLVVGATMGTWLFLLAGEPIRVPILSITLLMGFVSLVLLVIEFILGPITLKLNDHTP